MDLPASYSLVIARLNRRRNQADAILGDYAARKLTPWEWRFLSESLLSNLWIDWNHFVKSVLVASCNGGVTRTGIAFAARVAPDNSEARISLEVKKFTNGQQPLPGATYVGPLEPTWARPDKLVTCINGLAPSNTPTLLLAFGSANIVGPSRIQQVRNACAHKSRMNRIGVANLKASYSAQPFKDPVDIIWGTNPSTNSVALFEWISDLEDIAEIATL